MPKQKKPPYGNRDDLARILFEHGITYSAVAQERDLRQLAFDNNLIDAEGNVVENPEIPIPDDPLVRHAQLPPGTLVIRGDNKQFEQAREEFQKFWGEPLTAQSVLRALSSEIEVEKSSDEQAEKAVQQEQARAEEEAKRAEEQKKLADYIAWLENFAKEPILAKAKEANIQVNANMKVATMFARFRETENPENQTSGNEGQGEQT